MDRKSPVVTKFLDDQQHPLREAIERLRSILLAVPPGLEENVKWNGPNYAHDGEDRITMRIQPPKKLQLIFHRGAKKLAQPPARLIDDPSRLLEWKENDRAVATFKDLADIDGKAEALEDLATRWIAAANPT